MEFKKKAFFSVFFLWAQKLKKLGPNFVYTYVVTKKKMLITVVTDFGETR